MSHVSILFQMNAFLDCVINKSLSVNKCVHLFDNDELIRERLASFWRIIINTNQANKTKTEHLTIEQLHLNVHTCNYILLLGKY